jgi:nitrogen fixation/metabolism regulation signal transduction histidine kinase
LSHQRATIAQQNTMLTSLVAGLALLVVLIGILGIYFTHKVVGPIYKMKMLLRQVGEGKLNFHGKLRKGDELQDFFEVFAGMVEKLKDRQRREVTELERAIDSATAAGASDEAVDKLRHVRDSMRAALEL